MKHSVEKTETGFQCTVCKWNWKSRPTSDCPGVQRYEWGTAPDNLKTIGQLKKAGLKPNAPYRGIVQGGKGTYELFDMIDAIPFTPEEISAEKERKRRSRYITCKHCKREVRKEKWDSYWKACNKCLDGVIKAHYERERIEEELRQEEMEQMITKDRDEAILQARSWLALGDGGVILDTETTGLESDAEVVQVSVIGLDGQTMCNCLVKPVELIPEVVIGIHGITNEMVEDASSFEEIYPVLTGVLAGKSVIAYNADFDSRILAQSGRRYGLPVLPVKEWICAMEGYAQYFGEWSEYHGSYRWQRLPGGDHSARGDCIATLELIKRMASARLSTEVSEQPEAERIE